MRELVGIVAVAGVSEAHDIVPLNGCVEPLLSSSRTLNTTVVPTAAVGLVGETFKPTTMGEPTVRVVCPVTPESVAEMTDAPLATPVANPEAFIVAAAVVAEAHVTWPVMSCVVFGPPACV
jgi:hypothetical protein